MKAVPESDDFFLLPQSCRDDLEAIEMALHYGRCETPDLSIVSGGVLAGIYRGSS